MTCACPVCGFDPADYGELDAEGTLRSFAKRWEWLHEGAPARFRAPDPTVTVGSDAQKLDAVHAGTHALAVAGRRLHDAGCSPTGTGVVEHIHVGGGGPAKAPVREVAIGHRGLEGDRQAERRHHGRVWQAVSLWSAEMIEGLADEGHPIGPGRAGENLTLSGLDWSALRPGARLGLGEEVVLELTAWAQPCRKIAGCFSDRRFGRVDHEHHPGQSRAYASVRATGSVSLGDPVVVEP